MNSEGPMEPADPLIWIEAVKYKEAAQADAHHDHEAYELYYLVSGERYFFIKDRTYHLHKGDLVLIPTHVLHKTSSARKDGHERILINFRWEALNGLLPEYEAQIPLMFAEFPHIRLSGKEQAVIRRILDSMLFEMEADKPGAERYARLLLAEMVLLLLRLTEGRHAEVAEFPNSLHHKVSEVARYIGDHYGEPITLNGLSDQFRISPFYLSRIFHQVTGLPVVSYINHVRVEEARLLLASTDLSVTEVALRTGYQSVTHFGRVFKSAVGLSPQKFRQEKGRG
ncbi:AraC family transcriptional regulator [Gorillibacterium timonense]|uniref:AraC family transcriptional regulator n=1 Tax=Gorillibacterium timonense TaxID=1689269 RepID=UPI00071DDE2E|nr:AraC family transcriptional regulator [Gorillibacterium timonense]